MKVKTNINHQQGVVLIFSLVMLLLLTLVSVNMIQANQLELAMTANALEQTKELARAEIYLAQAEIVIENKRVAKRSNTLFPGRCFSNPNSKWQRGDEINLVNQKATASITGVYCLIGTSETECDGSTGLSPACKCDQGHEIYTIKLTTKIGYGTQRTIESKYSVNCTLGQL